MKLAHILNDAFLAPLRHRNRFLTFMGISLGLFGFGLISITQLYLLISTNPMDFLGYIIVVIAFESFVMSPLVYYFYRCHDGFLFRCSLVALLVFGLVVIITSQPTGWQLGLFVGALFGALFPAHHCAMLANTSDEKRGYETIFSQTISVLFSIGSAILGAYWLEHNQHQLALIIGCAAMLVGICAIFLASPWLKQESFAQYKKEIKQSLQHKHLISMCLRFGSYDNVNWIGPAIAAVAGFSALATGGIYAASSLLTVLFAPVIGFLIHQKKNCEHIIGHLLICLGWVFIILAPKQPVYFTIGIIMAQCGFQFIVPSLQAGWYNLKMPGAVMVKEAALGVTRVIFVIAATLILMQGVNALYCFMLLPLIYSLCSEIIKKQQYQSLKILNINNTIKNG